MKADNSNFEENFGFVDPIGSNQEMIFLIIQEKNLSYLKLGIGVPWAGQVIPTPMFDDIVKVDDSNFEENFGFVDPIGSNQETIFLIIQGKI